MKRTAGLNVSATIVVFTGLDGVLRKEVLVGLSTKEAAEPVLERECLLVGSMT